MVDLEADLIRHILPADLAGVIVPDHDLLPELGRHPFPLVFGMVFREGTFVSDPGQLIIPVLDPGIGTGKSVILHRNGIRDFLIVGLPVPGLVADQEKPVAVLVIYGVIELLFPPFLEPWMSGSDEITTLCFPFQHNLFMLLKGIDPFLIDHPVNGILHLWEPFAGHIECPGKVGVGKGVPVLVNQPCKQGTSADQDNQEPKAGKQDGEGKSIQVHALSLHREDGQLCTLDRGNIFFIHCFLYLLLVCKSFYVR